MGIRESLLNTITSVADSDFVRIVTSAGASSKATVRNLFKGFESNLGAKSSLTTSDYIRVVGTDNNSYKQTLGNVANTYEQNLGQKSSLTVNDYIRVVGSDNASYKQLVSDVAKKIIENYTGSSLAGSNRSVKAALDSLNSKSTNLSKIYRFAMSAGAVSANQSPTITKDYAPDDDVYIQNNVLHFNFSGTVMVMTHVAGATVANNRAWFRLKGNVNESEIHYGAYITFNNIQIVQVAPSFTFDITAVEAFTINGGNTGPSCIFVTRL